MMKVSVLIPIYRPGYTDTIVQSLQGQTLPKSEWELVLVDELYEARREHLKTVQFNLKHIPQKPSPDIASTAAINIGLSHCEGDLVYLMCDYNYPHPRCLERHWEIYNKYGPKVIISGPLIDGFTILGKSIGLGTAMEVRQRIRAGNFWVEYSELTPPVPLQLKEPFPAVTPENMASIWAKPFHPVWPMNLVADWRMGVITNISLERNLYECIPRTPVGDNKSGSHWFWYRNDSAPLEGLRAIGGTEETTERHLPSGTAPDTLVAMKLMEWGCRYLVDREAPSYMLPHPWRKKL